MQTIKDHKIKIIILIILLIALIGLLIAFFMGCFTPKTQTLNIKVETDTEWTEDYTPVVLHVEGTQEDNQKVEFYHAIKANGTTNTINLTLGKYSFKVLPCLNSTGAMYKYEDSFIREIKKGEDIDDISITLKSVSASKFTDKIANTLTNTYKETNGMGDDSYTETDLKDILGTINSAQKKASANKSYKSSSSWYY